MQATLKIPRYTFADVEPTKDNVDRQLIHLESELSEVHKCFGQNDLKGMKEELIDVIHSATTLLFILGADIHRENEKVIEKNNKRGYISKDFEAD